MDHQGILPQFIRIEIHIYGKVPFLQIEDDEPVEPDGVLERLQDGFAFFHALTADFADDEVISDAHFFDNRGQGLDLLEVDGLGCVGHNCPLFRFLQS